MPGFSGTDRESFIRAVVEYPIAMLRSWPRVSVSHYLRIYALLIGPQF
jgi:hypothetical protein